MNQQKRPRSIKRLSTGLAVAGVGVGASMLAVTSAQAAPAPQYVSSDSASCFSIPAPAKPGDLAVLNVITTDALANGYTTARAIDAAATASLPINQRTSTGNFLGDATNPELRSTDPNMVVAEIGTVATDATEGGVCVDLTAGKITAGEPAANLIVDYLGYMPADGGATPLDKQTRLVDTRTDKTPVKSDDVLWINTVSAEKGDAVLVNALVPFPKSPGYALVLGEDDTPNNKVTDPRSVVNFAINTTPFNVNANPNTALAVVGTDKKIGVEPHTADGSAVDVVVDQLAVIDAEKVLPVDPVRVYDTRSAGALKSGESVCFGLPAAGKGMTAIVNVTVDTRPEYTGTDSFGWAYIRPKEAKTGMESMNSTANFKPFNGRGNIDPNTTMVTLGDSEEVCVDALNGTGKPVYFIVDLLGMLEAGTFVDATTTDTGRERLVDTRKGELLPDLSPLPAGVIELMVDPDGNGTNQLSEYVKVTNTTKGSIDMTGWTIKDAAAEPHVYTFGKNASFVLGPEASVTLYTGSGTDSTTDLYWDADAPLWNNDGDTATLSNAKGVVIATYTYPKK